MSETSPRRPLSRDEAIRILRSHAHDLRARGVRRLALFGSVARNEAGPDSDVDLLLDIDDSRDLSLVGLAGLRLDLCDALGRDVEIVERPFLKPYIRSAILAEAVEIF